MANDNEKVQVAQLEISPTVKWEKPRAGIEELRRMLDSEVIHLAHCGEIRNAYSSITWVKLCCEIKHEGEAA
jgi:hypothetical protein